MLNTLVKKVTSVALLGAFSVVPFLSFNVNSAVAETAKLEITNTVDKQLADRGETLSYTVTIKNTGDVDTTTTFARLTAPNLAEYVPGSSNYTRSTNGTNRSLTDAWVKDGVNFGTVPAGTNVVLKYQTKVAQNANNDNIIWSVVTVDSDQTSDAGANSWTRVILKNPGICADKTADKTSVSAGDIVTFTIKVCNNGNVVLNDVLIFDRLDSRFDYVAGSTTLTLAGQTVKIDDGWLNLHVNAGNINPGQEAFLKFQVKVNSTIKDGETIRNVAQVKSNETPNWLQCAVELKTKVLGITTPTPTPTPTELPNTGPGEVLLLISGLVPAGWALKKFKASIR